MDRPLDSERRVIPQDGALVLRKPVVRGLVEKLGNLANYQIAVGETLRNKELPLVVRG